MLFRTGISFKDQVLFLSSATSLLSDRNGGLDVERVRTSNADLAPTILYIAINR